jgi:uncharacterized protein
MKLLIWLVLGAVVVLWWLHQKKLKAAARQASAVHAASADSASAPKADAGPERMLPCATCGVHLPRSEAIVSPDGKLAWCCEAHQRQAQQASAH